MAGLNPHIRTVDGKVVLKVYMLDNSSKTLLVEPSCTVQVRAFHYCSYILTCHEQTAVRIMADKLGFTNAADDSLCFGLHLCMDGVTGMLIETCLLRGLICCQWDAHCLAMTKSFLLWSDGQMKNHQSLCSNANCLQSQSSHQTTKPSFSYFTFRFGTERSRMCDLSSNRVFTTLLLECIHVAKRKLFNLQLCNSRKRLESIILHRMYQTRQAALIFCFDDWVSGTA